MYEPMTEDAFQMEDDIRWEGSMNEVRSPSFDADDRAVLDDSVNDLVSLTVRLAQLMAEEADHLADYKVSPIATLNEEKLRLVAALETQKKQLARFENVGALLSEEQRKRISNVAGVFQKVASENFQRLKMARLVNQSVVEAISEVVAEHSRNPSYTRAGHNAMGVNHNVAITLNQSI